MKSAEIPGNPAPRTISPPAESQGRWFGRRLMKAGEQVRTADIQLGKSKVLRISRLSVMRMRDRVSHVSILYTTIVLKRREVESEIGTRKPAPTHPSPSSDEAGRGQPLDWRHAWTP